MKICPRCKSKYTNQQAVCSQDGQKLFPFWYSLVRMWHAGLCCLVFGLLFGYLGIWLPIQEARSNADTTIHLRLVVIFASTLFITVGAAILLNQLRSERSEKVALCVGVCLAIVATILLVMVLDRMGYPFKL